MAVDIWAVAFLLSSRLTLAADLFSGKLAAVFMAVADLHPQCLDQCLCRLRVAARQFVAAGLFPQLTALLQ